MPTIVLGTDEVDCFCAWVSAEAGLPEHAEAGSDLKVGYLYEKIIYLLIIMKLSIIVVFL